MENLPYEIVEQILIDPQLGIKDILNVAETCTYLHNFQKNNNHFWKKKYQANWPQFMKMFSDDFDMWFEEIRYIYKLTKLVHALLEQMSAKYTTSLDCDFINEWQLLLQESPRTYEYMVLDLMSIIHNTAEIRTIETVPVDTPGNYTLKYYATKVLIFLRHSHLRKMWKKFIQPAEEQQTFEDAAIFVAQWFQPTVETDVNAIKQELDNLAYQVLKRLQVINPNHPLHQEAGEIILKWRDQNFTLAFTAAECRDIIRCLMEVLQEYNHPEEGCGIEKHYFINKVLQLKTGIPLLVNVIYASVGRRLGLKFILTDFTIYCIFRALVFKEGLPRAEYCYVDIFQGFNMIRMETCPALIPHNAKTVVETITYKLNGYYKQNRHYSEMTHYLRLSIELLQMLAPNSPTAMNALKNTYVSHGVFNHHHIRADYLAPLLIQESLAIDVCCAMEECTVQFRKPINDSPTKNLPKQRPKTLLFAVGMVMQHKQIGNMCVIYDWDPTYVKSPLQKHIEMYKLKRKDQQPFYKVLLDLGDSNNAYAYVAEEELNPVVGPCMMISNADLGRHFSHFFKTHYVPNMIVEELFPEDRAVRHYFHDLHLHSLK